MRQERSAFLATRASWRPGNSLSWFSEVVPQSIGFDCGWTRIVERILWTGNRRRHARLSSAFDGTRMWRCKDGVILEQKPSTRLSHEPCFGVNLKAKRSCG